MTNNKQQTSVEWLVEQLQKTRDWQRVINEVNQSSTSVRNVIEQAKQIEKNQIKSIFCDGLICGIQNPKVTPKQYYKQIWEGGDK